MDDLFGFAIESNGATRELSPVPARASELEDNSFTWVHAFAPSAEAESWLKEAGLPPLALSALLAEETRPRCTVHEDFALLNLRGVNLNPGAQPEDMVSLRLFLSKSLVVTVNKRKLEALADVLEHTRRDRGPTTPGELVARFALRLADRAEPVVAMLNERIDDLEDEAESDPANTMRARLADVRRVSITLRRFMFPQRDALSTLEIEMFDWISPMDRAHLREATERMTRLCEELDLIRDRAQVVQDMIMEFRAEAMNRQTVLLTVVAAIFLPLGLVTGLLGVNLGGIPGSSWPGAFWVLCGLLLGIAAFQIWLFRRIGLLSRKDR